MDRSSPTERTRGGVAVPIGRRTRRGDSPPSARLRKLVAGGTDGNERLTVLTGLLLIVLLAALGVTIVWIGQLLWLHLFLGLLLIGPVVLKLLSTGYRFIRYYTASRAYQSKGPPPRILRVLGPLVVLSTFAVFATGVALLLLGPGSRQPWLLLHKVGFIAWIAVVAVHVLGHVPEILGYLSLRTTLRRGTPDAATNLSGAGGRSVSLALAVLSGLALALALIPQFAGWTR